MDMGRTVLKTRHYRAGYEVRTELLSGPEYGMPEGESMTMQSAYTPSGDYIGTSRDAHFLCSKRGIKPGKAQASHRVCSIGFCDKEQKWYGWSHRAIHGFAVGDTVTEGDCVAQSGWTDEYLAEHPKKDLSLPVGFVAYTLEDARRMAVAFAESVS